MAVLSDAERGEIKAHILAGSPGRRIAELYGIDPSTVCAVKRGEIWRHVAPGAAVPPLQRKPWSGARRDRRLPPAVAVDVKLAVIRGGSLRGVAASVGGVEWHAVRKIVRGETYRDVGPFRGQSERDGSCGNYAKCLEIAARAEWEQFGCAGCAARVVAQ